MSYILQSSTTLTLYHNGTILDKKGYVIALFDTIDTARIFENESEAVDVSEIICVPVNIIEV